MSRRPQYTPEEGRELSKRLEQMRSTGGVAHAAVHQEMLDDMERDLRQMVRDYDGTDSRGRELLEALVIARESGVQACDEIEHELALKLRKTA